MKSFIVIILVILTFPIAAQIKTGEIIYDVYVSSDDPRTSAWMEQNMQNASAELYFTDGKTRTNMFLGSFMTQSSIHTNEKDSILILIDGMRGKYAMRVAKNDTSNKMMNAFKVENIDFTDESKKIIGYTCQKAIVTYKNGEKSEIWFTKEILPTYREGRILINKIPGTPLEIHSTWGGKAKMKMVAYQVKKKIKNAEEVFNFVPPKDFTLMTTEQLKALQGTK